MTKRNLYNSLSEYKKSKNDDYLMNVLSSCDGKTDFETICNINNLSKLKTLKAINILIKNNLIYKTKL